MQSEQGQSGNAATEPVCDIYVQRGSPTGKGAGRYRLQATNVPISEAAVQVHALRAESGVRWAYCTEPRDA